VSDDELDLAGWDVGVLALALAYGAGGLQHELAAQLTGLLAQGLVPLHVEAQLRDPEAVAEVDEGHAAQVARALHPSDEGHGLSGIGEAELAASVRTVHGRSERSAKIAWGSR